MAKITKRKIIILAIIGITVITLITGCAQELARDDVPTATSSANSETSVSETSTQSDEELIEIPNCMGMSLVDAEEKIRTLNLKCSYVQSDGTVPSIFTLSDWRVDAQNPVAGTKVEPKTTVTLTVTNVSGNAVSQQSLNVEKTNISTTQAGEEQSPTRVACITPMGKKYYKGNCRVLMNGNA